MPFKIEKHELGSEFLEAFLHAIDRQTTISNESMNAELEMGHIILNQINAWEFATDRSLTIQELQTLINAAMTEKDSITSDFTNKINVVKMRNSDINWSSLIEQVIFGFLYTHLPHDYPKKN